MKQYLLSMYQPDGDPPPPEVLGPIMRNLDLLREEMKAAGVWVFSGGLHPPSTATVLRVQDTAVLMTDGFTIINAPDLDAALDWGSKLARAIGLLPIEVRPFQGGGEG